MIHSTLQYSMLVNISINLTNMTFIMYIAIRYRYIYINN